LQRLLAVHAAGALAGAARLVDHLASALTGGAGALDGEEALLGAHPAAAVAGHAAGGLRATLGPAAMAGIAGRRSGHADLRGLAAESILEGDFHIVAQIGAARRGAAPGPHEIAEHLVEDVGEAAGGEAE